MQTILLTCLFGGICAAVLWVAGAASAMRDQMMQRGGRLWRAEEL